MIRLMLVVTLMQILLLTGCVANIGAPQTRDAFVEMVKPGGITRKIEHMTIDRPFKTVLNDVKDYTDKCLNVRVTRRGSYQYKEVGGSTTYHPKIAMTGNKSAALSVQEEYGSKRANSGAPPGGVFVMVTEIRAAGDNKTQVEIYHLLKGELVKPLKQWISSDKRQCPSF